MEIPKELVRTAACCAYEKGGELSREGLTDEVDTPGGVPDGGPQLDVRTAGLMGMFTACRGDNEEESFPARIFH